MEPAINNSDRDKTIYWEPDFSLMVLSKGVRYENALFSKKKNDILADGLHQSIDEDFFVFIIILTLTVLSHS